MAMTAIHNKDLALAKLSGTALLGLTAIFFRASPGVVLKAPVHDSEDGIIRFRPSVAQSFQVEREILTS